jgi:hypothetical protein
LEDAQFSSWVPLLSCKRHLHPLSAEKINQNDERGMMGVKNINYKAPEL